MIKVSDIAKEKAIQLMKDDGFNPETDYIRVGVKSGGCSGLEYVLKFDKEKTDIDQVFEDNGIKIIVDKKEYDNLKYNSSQGRYMSLSDVLQLLSVSRPWLLDNVLNNSKIRKEIDVELNPDGFVKYPENQGGRYFFLASKTKQWFEENFREIMV